MYHHRLAPMLIWNSMMPQPSHCSPPAIIFSQQCISGKSCVCVLLIQLCLTVCEPMDCSPPGSSVHVILQARILEWTAIPLTKGSSQPTDGTQVSCISGRFFTVCFTIWATQELLPVVPLQCKIRSCHFSAQNTLMVSHLILIKTQHLMKTYNWVFLFITAGLLSNLMLYFNHQVTTQNWLFSSQSVPLASACNIPHIPLSSTRTSTFSLQLECFSM